MVGSKQWHRIRKSLMNWKCSPITFILYRMPSFFLFLFSLYSVQARRYWLCNPDDRLAITRKHNFKYSDITLVSMILYLWSKCNWDVRPFLDKLRHYEFNTNSRSRNCIEIVLPHGTTMPTAKRIEQFKNARLTLPLYCDLRKHSNLHSCYLNNRKFAWTSIYLYSGCWVWDYERLNERELRPSAIGEMQVIGVEQARDGLSCGERATELDLWMSIGCAGHLVLANQISNARCCISLPRYQPRLILSRDNRPAKIYIFQPDKNNNRFHNNLGFYISSHGI